MLRTTSLAFFRYRYTMLRVLCSGTGDTFPKCVSNGQTLAKIRRR